MNRPNIIKNLKNFVNIKFKIIFYFNFAKNFLNIYLYKLYIFNHIKLNKYLNKYKIIIIDETHLIVCLKKKMKKQIINFFFKI